MKSQTPTAAEIMTQGVYTLSPDTPVTQAATMMLKRGFSGAPVVGKDNEVVGIFSERDCMDVLASAAWNDRPEGTVSDMMSTDVFSIAPETDLFQLVTLFHTQPHRRLPVVEENRLVGLITRRDVMRALQAVEQTGASSEKRYTMWEMPPR
jgi:CBS domain-containing protein